MSKFFQSEKVIVPELDIDDNINSDTWMKALPDEYREKLRSEYATWLATERVETDMSEEELKDTIISDLDFVCKMPAEEYTLYRKFLEIKKKYPDKRNKKSAGFFDFGTEKSVGADIYPKLREVKSNIWVPESLEDYQNLRPTLIITNNSPLNDVWNILRTFVSTQINNTNIGRNLYFIVQDEVTGKYLGVMNISSDFLDLTPRDNYIGWSKDVKTGQRMINHTAIGSTIVPTQPLGFNYVGGKLLALLTVSNIVEENWNRMYDTPEMPSKLVGMTTTSLYSSFSQYQNLSYWNKRGHSAGSIRFEPTKQTLETVKKYIQTHYPLKYWEWYVATEPGGMPLKRDFKQRSLSFMYTKLKIDKSYYQTNHSRGIYFCPFYDNMKEYLRKEITEDELIRRKGFNNNVYALGDLWKNKYAKKRVASLVKNDRVDLNEALFYDDIVSMTWEETKEKYLKDIGR